jgi:anti-sigma regulatory factor (Ser/Thr protein kinase)
MRQTSHPIRSVAIADLLDVFTARRVARDLAAIVGFTRQEQAELMLVVGELGSNIVKYGHSGSITLEIIEDERLGLRVVAHDRGPALESFDTALNDGCNDRGPLDPTKLFRRGGLGTGLGAVRRLTHHFAYRRTENGNEFSALRFAGIAVARV